MEDAVILKHLQQPFEGGARPALLEDDENLQPYLPDDALLPALSCEMWGDVCMPSMSRPSYSSCAFTIRQDHTIVWTLKHTLLA